MANNVITVTALNRYVRDLLERDSVLTDIALRGEISNFVHHRSGHCYFSLKDENSSVKAVMWRSDAAQLAFEPENGMNVIVQCRITLYERDGAFQVVVMHMVPDGVGAMQLAFEQLKAKLDKEGLFAAEHKKPLPVVPQCVGLVTSKTGAAIQDIFNVTRRRYPMAKFLLAPVTVQGEHAAPEIAAAISMLDASHKVDVIIVARGGGSKEDLWVFNNEQIARAAYACHVPVVSAVGHEIDFSILDFVADCRAPTPSAAAELVMPDIMGMRQEIYKLFMNIGQNMQNRIQMCYNETMQLREALSAQIHLRIGEAQRTLQHAALLCDTLSPMRVLARGYSIARKGDSVLKDAKLLAVGDEISVRLQQGLLYCDVVRIAEEGAKNE